MRKRPFNLKAIPGFSSLIGVVGFCLGCDWVKPNRVSPKVLVGLIGFSVHTETQPPTQPGTMQVRKQNFVCLGSTQAGSRNSNTVELTTKYKK